MLFGDAAVVRRRGREREEDESALFAGSSMAG